MSKSKREKTTREEGKKRKSTKREYKPNSTPLKFDVEKLAQEGRRATEYAGGVFDNFANRPYMGDPMDFIDSEHALVGVLRGLEATFAALKIAMQELQDEQDFSTWNPKEFDFVRNTVA